MTSLVDKLVPDDLWAIVKPYCHHHTAHPKAADTAPSPTAMLRRHRVHDPHLNSLAAVACPRAWLRFASDGLTAA